MTREEIFARRGDDLREEWIGDPFWQNFSFQQRPRLGVKGAEERRCEINKIWFTRSNKSDRRHFSRSITPPSTRSNWHRRNRHLDYPEQPHGPSSSLRSSPREREREREEQRSCETKDRFGNGLKGDFDPPLREPFCVSYETRCV